MRPRRWIAAAAGFTVALGVVAASAAAIQTLDTHSLFGGQGGASLASGTRSATIEYEVGANSLTVTVTGSNLSQLVGQHLRLALITGGGPTIISRTISTGSGGNAVVGSNAVITLQRGSETWPGRADVTDWALMLGGELLVERGDNAGASITVASGVLAPVVLEPGDPITEPEGPPPPYDVNVIDWELLHRNPVQVCANVVVTGTSPTPEPWRVRIVHTQAPFYGQNTGFQLQNYPGTGDAWRYAIFTDPVTGEPYVTANAANQATHGTVATGQTHRFRICNYALPSPANEPELYTVTFGPVFNGDSGFQRCQTATIAGVNANWKWPFGWTFTFDHTAIRQAVMSAGRTVSTITHGPNAWEFTVVTSGTSAQITNNAPSSLMKLETRSITACAVSY